MYKILSSKNTSYTIFLYFLWGCHKHNCLKANTNSWESLYESFAIPSQPKPSLMWHWRCVWGCLSNRDEYSSVAKNGPWRAATEPEAVLTVALGWTCWFMISNPLRLLWCGQLCVFLRMVESLLVFPMGYIRLSRSLTSDTLTSASLAALMLARIPCRRSLRWLTGAVAVLSFSLCRDRWAQSGPNSLAACYCISGAWHVPAKPHN